MSIEEFINTRPFLYHLTDQGNLPQILPDRFLLSADTIANSAFNNAEQAGDFLRTKRTQHVELVADGRVYKIRDQRPISLTVLERSLTDDLTPGDFLRLLNSRVFWWPTIDRLDRHFKRYVQEEPVILKVRTEEIFVLNQRIEFCRWNSGATRCHPSYGGNAPPRGYDTFLPADLYQEPVKSVAEVTFPDQCFLPQNIWLGYNPNGDWEQV